MTNSELKFASKVFSRMCKASDYCVDTIYSIGYMDDDGDCGGILYNFLTDIIYTGKIRCPIVGHEKELSCGNCTEEDWYRTLKEIGSKRND